MSEISDLEDDNAVIPVEARKLNPKARARIYRAQSSLQDYQNDTERKRVERLHAHASVTLPKLKFMEE